MKIPANRIELATSTEKSRYSLRAIKLDAAAKTLTATDGHILARVPVEVEANDSSGLIPPDAFTQARKAKLENMHVNSKVTLEDKREFELVSGQYPNVEAVMPKDVPTLPTICFDPDLLLRLVNAIQPRETGKYASKRCIALYVKDRESAVVVRAHNQGGGEVGEAIGLMMPVRDDKFERKPE